MTSKAPARRGRALRSVKLPARDPAEHDHHQHNDCSHAPLLPPSFVIRRGHVPPGGHARHLPARLAAACLGPCRRGRRRCGRPKRRSAHLACDSVSQTGRRRGISTSSAENSGNCEQPRLIMSGLVAFGDRCSLNVTGIADVIKGASGTSALLLSSTTRASFGLVLMLSSHSSLGLVL